MRIGGIGVLLLLYCVITLLPFYFLIIRSFVPTKDSTQLHLWPPKISTDSLLNAKLGSMATFYNLDLEAFKTEFGIDEYLNQNMRLSQLAAKYHIPDEKVIAYLRPFVMYNGWYNILGNRAFFRAIWANVYICAISILLGGMLGILTGTGLAGLQTRWQTYIYQSYLLQMIIPPVMVMVPTYLIFNRYLHLSNSYWNLILLNIKGGALSTMVFTSYIATIPKEIEESIEIDGGSRLTYLWHAVLPLAKTPFAVFVSIMLPLFWNDLLNGRIYLNPDKYTLMPLISSFAGQFTTNFQAIYAGLLCGLLPMIVVYLAFQKLFVRSALAGAVKG
ncbi:sugar ABC transporter, permease protein [Candidatus Moduliflexus flocculans]|uniref:Sugar ABC transporter, permease protein n=1 Tax=Candidatus Moduliflexus flocculans TaxID=1499966 RepID=A0A0S6VVR1_9BACT|nr:sugar ABC transporter, permease protein [Candidatus Moduliflexus flocculans]